jgi:hypothetical protein
MDTYHDANKRMVPDIVFIVEVPRVACAPRPVHLTVSRVTALIRILSEAPLLSMP